MRIKNWSKHQHFKDRSPPWIKLYRDILDDPDWHELDGETAKVLVSLWLIASEDETHNGLLPDRRRLAFRLRIKESQLNQALTKLSHWLIHDDINVISERYQVDAPETEREAETDKRQTSVEAQAPLPDWVPSESWSGYVEMRKKIRKPMTDRARKLVLASLERMHEKGIDVGLVLDNSTKNSWIDVYEPKDSSRQVVNLFAGAI